MSVAALIRSMAAAGASPEAIAIAVEAVEAVGAQLEAKRATARDKKRRQREGQSQDKTGTVPGQVGDRPDETLSLPPSPQTPQPPTHTRVSINTREAEVRENAAFGGFWIAYPRKVSKADARKAFRTAWKKLPPDEAELTILGGLERAKAAWSDAQFIPHAATWLNGERWNDEPAEIPQLRPQGPRHERSYADQRQSAREDSLRDMHAGAMAALNRRLG